MLTQCHEIGQHFCDICNVAMPQDHNWTWSRTGLPIDIFIILDLYGITVTIPVRLGMQLAWNVCQSSYLC